MLAASARYQLTGSHNAGLLRLREILEIDGAARVVA
jgi:hypothetical protein